MSTSGGIMMHVKIFQYIGRCSVHRGMFSTSGVFSTLGDIHEYIGEYHEYIEGCSVHCGIPSYMWGSKLIDKSLSISTENPDVLNIP